MINKKTNMKKKSICNICQKSIFVNGPLGRLSLHGDKPQCENCGSLERHRIIRTVWEYIPIERLEGCKVLQFSLDPSVDAKWFSKLEVSIYGNKNSLDLQEIEKNDAIYDIVICNQILEHVADDKSAFRELIRILKPKGFLQMTVPNPILRKETEDWGYPKENFHGHYRHYGIDLIEYFAAVCPEVYLVYVKTSDQVTNEEDYVFFYTKSRNIRDNLVNDFSNKSETELCYPI